MARSCAVLTAHTFTTYAPARGHNLAAPTPNLTSRAVRTSVERANLAEHAACRNRNYAARTGCAFTAFHDADVNASLHPSWHKAPLILDAITRHPNRAVLWLDSDAVVQDRSASPTDWLRICEQHAPPGNPPIQLVLQSTPQWHAAGAPDALAAWQRYLPTARRLGLNYCCKGTCTCAVDAGVMIWHPRGDRGPTRWASGLLQELLARHDCARYHNHRQWEQDCLQIVLRERGLLPTASEVAQAMEEHPSGEAVPLVKGHVCYAPYTRFAFRAWGFAFHLRNFLALCPGPDRARRARTYVPFAAGTRTARDQRPAWLLAPALASMRTPMLCYDPRFAEHACCNLSRAFVFHSPSTRDHLLARRPPEGQTVDATVGGPLAAEEDSCGALLRIPPSPPPRGELRDILEV